MMRIRFLARLAIAAALLGAAAAQSQTAAVPRTDVGPPPAEERDSVGAIVLEKSLVRAQRSPAFRESAARTGVGTIGAGMLRSTLRVDAQAELASARAEEAADFRRRGAGALTEQ